MWLISQSHTIDLKVEAKLTPQSKSLLRELQGLWPEATRVDHNWISFSPRALSVLCSACLTIFICISLENHFKQLSQSIVHWNSSSPRARSVLRCLAFALFIPHSPQLGAEKHSWCRGFQMGWCYALWSQFYKNLLCLSTAPTSAVSLWFI